MKVSTMLYATVPAAVLGLAMSGAALAAQSDSVPEVATTPEATEKDIVLPDTAAPEAREAAADGLERANAARADGRAFGEARASAAADNADAADASAEVEAEVAAEAAADNPGAERRR